MFSTFCGTLNTLGWYSTVSLPTSGSSINQAQVTEFTDSVGKTSINAWTGYTVIALCYNVIIAAAKNLLTIVPFLTDLGVPLSLALAIQTPIWLVLAIGVYGLWTGHVLTMME